LVGVAEQVAQVNIGVSGIGQNGTGETIGGQFYAAGGGAGNIGVSSTVPGLSSSGDWAGRFQGDVEITNDLWANGNLYPSDANLKENVTPMSGALAMIIQLEPSFYNYDTVDFEFLTLPSGPQAGLIAQDAALVIPGIVKHTVFPAQYDSNGTMINPASPYAGIDYARIVPYLIGAIQEQNDRIDLLEAQLATCCPLDGDVVPTLPEQGSGHGGVKAQVTSSVAAGQLRIQPNPMIDRTTITYNLESAGQVRLIVSTTSGKQLRVLEESQREAGSFTYEWNTTELASGVYNVMLLVDGAPLVQKAVKIER
jgi:hypothetical protein